MKIKQLSLFIENRPGALNKVCQTLKEHHISIRTLALADTQQFGILRLLVKEWEEAKKALEAAGFIVKVTEVLALPVDDRAGGLAELLDILQDCQVEYMYAFTFGHGGKAIMVFRFEDLDKALETLRQAHVDVIEAVELLK
ncbi:hypothetical protein SDC9_135046 [bioreactor metagenome]|uniref:ACT domain-containing protein n=1 Tax=bioreactor metagenome TaxID=1076179 RepID=A0A645DFF1_9ZZZZ